jgi:excisionase family DNA binding protein
MYTPEQVRDICGVNLETVYRWLRSGKLNGVKVGDKLWRISTESMDEFLGKGVSKSDETR